MRISLGLPTHRVDRGSEFVSAAAITELARAAEAGGYDAVYVTEHPFPDAQWLATGGHHALDPFVALSFAAAATERIRLQTNLVVLAYRNPFLAAKSIASLDVLSGGRTIIGVGAGYLEGEFRALGADHARRNELTDESIRAMTAAWAGEEMTYAGEGFTAAGNVMLPRPLQRPRPPLWIGGNSRRAMRRVAELADGWAPMPTTGMTEGAVTSRLKTASIASTAALAERISELRQMFADAGRTDVPTVAFTPPSLLMARSSQPMSPAQFVEEAGELAIAGVSQLTLSFPGRTRRDLLAAMEAFAADVIPQLP
ncbi:MAG TPA: TIGR03619 family F420-dependent LLM class oxidoreductase [Frankiaceae bacterium]|jgi:probable F420-dependent oxidoreductase|nr:TIGR03619 family F420-dependent LLM class oxidoreductase [Frankiaceae bacterium]